METCMRFHSNAHLPESEESEEQPGVHGFVPHSSEEKPLHSLRHSWETTFTGGRGRGRGPRETQKKKKPEPVVVRSPLNATDEG